jgi:hypothetical protein
MVMWLVPKGASPPIFIVMVEVPEPGAGIVAGLNVAPLVSLDVSATAPSKPETIVEVMVVVPEAPWAIVSDLGDALRLKLLTR